MELNEAMRLLPPLKDMKASIREEREAIMLQHRRLGHQRRYPFAFNRGACLYACDANNNRLNDGDWHDWLGTKLQVAKLLVQYPDCDEIFYDGGVDFAETMEAYKHGNYEPDFMSATLYRKADGPNTIKAIWAEVEAREKAGET